MGQRVLGERGKKYVGLPEFARVSAQILAEMDLEQQRGTVTTLPDERTIRFYLAEGLIQAPEEKQGTASVFGYLNLLQLLTIKKLQAEHLPIRKIRELVAGKSEEELETLLGISGTSKKKTRENEAKQYLESLLAPSMSRAQTSNSRPRQVAPAAPFMELEEKAAADSFEEPGQPPVAEQSWQRVEIEPGLELHIRSDYTPPTTSAKSKGLADKIRGVIGRYWK